MRRHPPLQTHSITDEKWVPPRGRFWACEASDEDWARPLGLGEVVHVKRALYDVRAFPDDRLIGYTSYDPSEYARSYGGMVQLPIHTTDVVRWPQSFQEIESVRPTPIETITVRVMRFGIDGKEFWTWYCELMDAEALVRAGWIECLDQDRLQEFAHRVRVEALQAYPYPYQWR